MSLIGNQSIPEGFKQTDVGEIPSDWKVVTIGEATTLIGDGIHSTPTYDPNGDYYFVNGNNINNGSLRFTENTKKVSESEYQKHKKKLNDRTLFLSINGTIGSLCFYKNEPIILGKSAAYININERTDVQYMYQALSSDATQLRFEDGLTGSTIKNLGLGTIKNTLVSLPPRKEQTAIANALSDVDALLTELEKLIAKKQAIKTATMQQLLTGKTRLPKFSIYTEGDKQGQLKGIKPSELGEIPEDWNIVSLNKVLKDIPKYGINAPAVSLQGNLPVYIRITDISEKGHFKPIELVGVNSPFSHNYQLEIGDIVLARTGASVGKSYLYNESDGKLVYAGFLIKISPVQNKLNPDYLFQYLKTDQYWSWVTVNSMRSGQPGINGNEYGQLPVLLPCIEEQAAIATILSDMDNEIQTLEQRLTKTRQIKQGMMQELLTGRTRLPIEDSPNAH